MNEKGRFDEAIPVLRKAIELNPKDMVAHDDLALALDGAGRHADAEPLLRDRLDRRRRVEKPDSPLLAADLALLGRNLLDQAKWSEAEGVLRECLAVREKAIPDSWQRFNAASLLGGALSGQGRYAEAEPLVLAGYEGLKRREGRLPTVGRTHLPDAAERIIRLYEAWGKPDKATAWKIQLGLADLPADVFASP